VFASAGSYTPGFVQVFRNGARLGNADFTATNGTTITLASAATAGDLVTIEYYTLTSLTNALPLTGGTVTGSTTFNSAVTVNGAAASGFTGMKNRIINGNMVVDQRNAGASVTPTTFAYTLDRWYADMTAASKFSVQQNAGAVTPPAGFSKYLGITSLAATSVGAGDYYTIGQVIEGLNTADLSWGSASASTITISFWVRSSLTGTFGGVLNNSGGSRAYPFTYTISAANTWEQKTVTVAGDTSGTWLTTNGAGIEVKFSLGVGSTYAGTAGAWTGSNKFGATGQVNMVATNGATFYITGVQLERGSNATSFEFIDAGRQLIQCQRYFQKLGNASYVAIGSGFLASANTSASGYVKYTTTMRSAPTTTFTSLVVTDRIGYDSAVSTFTPTAGTDSLYYSLTCAAGGTPYYPNVLAVTSGTSGFLALSAEL
jgi:hypothetical protein